MIYNHEHAAMFADWILIRDLCVISVVHCLIGAGLKEDRTLNSSVTV